MRGWLVPGFCPMTKIACASSKSSSVTVPLPAPMVSVKRPAAGLVAHVGAVRQIVGAKLPDEELIQKSRLVTGAARGVEDCFVRMIKRVQFAGDQIESRRPN